MGNIPNSVIPRNAETYAVNQKYVESNQKKFAEEYPGQFISVKDESVTAHGEYVFILSLSFHFRLSYYFKRYDHIFMNGGRNAFVVFPSNPEYKHPYATVTPTGLLGGNNNNINHVLSC